MAKTNPCKIDIWLSLFLDRDNRVTFLHKAESARFAGYKTTNEDSLRAIGSQNYLKVSDRIERWLDEEGLSDKALKVKLLGLLEGKQTTFQKIKGAVNKADLPDNCSVIATSGVTIQTEGGDVAGTGETILALKIDSPELQRRSLDMAFKVKGSYAPEKKELSGKDGGPVQMANFPPTAQSIDEWMTQKAKIDAAYKAAKDEKAPARGGGA